ncbi:hypothetical protein EP7_000601 [Isosphaeraceae bacterium EP7]
MRTPRIDRECTTICLPASLMSARRLKSSIHRFERSPKGPSRKAAWSQARGVVAQFLVDFEHWADTLTCDDFVILHAVARRNLPADVTRDLSPASCLMAFVLEVAGSDRPTQVPGASVFDLTLYDPPRN